MAPMHNYLQHFQATNKTGSLFIRCFGLQEKRINKKPAPPSTFSVRPFLNALPAQKAACLKHQGIIIFAILNRDML